MRRTRNHLRIYEGSENCNGSSESVDWLHGRAEDDDGRNYDRYTFHGVSDAKRQRRNLIQGHVRHLIIEMVENTLRCNPPIFIIITKFSIQQTVEIIQSCNEGTIRIMFRFKTATREPII